MRNDCVDNLLWLIYVLSKRFAMFDSFSFSENKKTVRLMLSEITWLSLKCTCYKINRTVGSESYTEFNRVSRINCFSGLLFLEIVCTNVSHTFIKFYKHQSFTLIYSFYHFYPIFITKLLHFKQKFHFMNLLLNLKDFHSKKLK